eukprot:CAMPEP_0171453512 /NCGR_PEP_ID=MMETSP0945-20130129/1190_1 /TAXON_ID=109269 /ORGANISM="Vaucheria litorea, Strain CCMP2940" /LENGTH=602 /DNA_ID=CAMNT_0011978393 /DNA_START=35 /DNA_END=1844 /DNA_ORIENTATION=-
MKSDLDWENTFGSEFRTPLTSKYSFPLSCPAYIDLNEKKTAQKSLLFIVMKENAFSIQNSKSLVQEMTSSNYRILEKNRENPRISSVEFKRKQFDQVLQHLSQCNDFYAPFGNPTIYDKNLMKRLSRDTFEESGEHRRASVRRLSRQTQPHLLENSVIRVLSEHHFSEEFAIATPASITFRRANSVVLKIDVGDLFRVALADENSETWLPGFSTVELHHLEEFIQFSFLVLSELKSGPLCISNDFISVHHGSSDRMLSDSNKDAISLISCDLELETSQKTDTSNSPFLLHSSAWKGKSRSIMNSRRIRPSSGKTIGSCGSTPNSSESTSSNNLVAELLLKIFSIGDDAAGQFREGGECDHLLEFMDQTGDLKWIDLKSLEEHNEKLSFFLNLYHLMILHAHLLLGSPGNSLKSTGYYNGLSYEVGDDVISLVELEHAILRAPMTRPRQFLAKYIFPSWKYSIALTIPEPRINFALSCGSLSGVSFVPIYKPDSLDWQLEISSAYYLNSTVEVLPSKLTVVLPKMLYWYRDDFGASFNQVLGSIARYLKANKRKELQHMLSVAENSISVKFHRFRWECKRLRYLTTDALEENEQSFRNGKLKH